MVVVLHTWSAERHNQVERVLPYVTKRQWNALFPEFRGPNLAENPRAHQACASILAMQDIVDAIEYVGARCAAHAPIFLLGGSGGGHMALMMAAYCPEMWNEIFAACPITDLARWHSDNPAYAPHIEACCGGPPDTFSRLKEYMHRSPVTYAAAIGKARVHIAHGKDDRSVPFIHSLSLYHRIHRARRNASVYLEIFDGGHEIRLDDAFGIFDRHAATQNTKETLSG